MRINESCQIVFWRKMYKYKTKPYEHQEKIFADSWCRKYFGLFMEMGTGKSKVAIDTMGRLFLEDRIKTCLILAPKGVFDNWVFNEIPRHLPSDIKVNVVRWQNYHTQTYTRQLEELIFPDLQKENTLQVFVMNVEALSTIRAMGHAKLFLNKNPDSLMIVDESTTIKNRSAKRTKNIIELGRLASYRRILTGSPITKSPMDLFSQCMFLSPNALGFKSYYAFQGRYAVVVNKTMGHRSFRDIVGYQRIDELNEKLEGFSSRVLKNECLDLPEKVYIKRDIVLTDEQMSAYHQMKKLALTELDQGKLSSTQSVLTQIMRLQQICCGFLKLDDGKIQDLPNNRLSELLSVVSETTGKVIIWATWTHDIKAIEKLLIKNFGEDSVATYYGETPQDRRQEIVQKFQDKNDKLRFFVGQPKTGGFGITLTEASTVVYYSNSYDLEIRLQSEDRAHRIGQQNKVTYIDIVAPKTIDEKILKALKDKINIAEKVLGEDARQWLI